MPNSVPTGSGISRATSATALENGSPTRTPRTITSIASGNCSLKAKIRLLRCRTKYKIIRPAGDQKGKRRRKKPQTQRQAECQYQYQKQRNKCQNQRCSMDSDARLCQPIAKPPQNWISHVAEAPLPPQRIQHDRWIVQTLAQLKPPIDDLVFTAIENKTPVDTVNGQARGGEYQRKYD